MLDENFEEDLDNDDFLREKQIENNIQFSFKKYVKRNWRFEQKVYKTYEIILT